MAEKVCEKGSSQIEGSQIWQKMCANGSSQREGSEIWQKSCVKKVAVR